MTYKPKALDLFCKAGGATRGLQQAGFEVHGIDLHPQPRYCGEGFTQADAVTFGTYEWFRQFDLVWASPPCQRYSAGAARWGTSQNHPHLIPVIRNRLIEMGVPYIIENISSATEYLHNPIMLCGTMFDLGVFRHRLFETSFPVVPPPHLIHEGHIGDGKYHTVTGHAGGSSKRDGWKGGGTAEWRVAMGIDWMVGNELAEAIPPAYSKFLGLAFLKSIGKIYGT